MTLLLRKKIYIYIQFTQSNILTSFQRIIKENYRTNIKTVTNHLQQTTMEHMPPSCHLEQLYFSDLLENNKQIAAEESTFYLR
jgi:hypothetical protein